jgi:hypothetical protein
VRRIFAIVSAALHDEIVDGEVGLDVGDRRRAVRRVRIG